MLISPLPEPILHRVCNAWPTWCQTYSYLRNCRALTLNRWSQGSYRKLCGFPDFSRKKLLIFQTFTLKSTFHDFRGAGSRDGSILSLPILIQYQNYDHEMSAIYNESKVTDVWWSINQCDEKLWATIALRAIVARQSTQQFTKRDTHNQNV